MKQCWNAKGSKRPTFPKIVDFLKKILDSLPKNQKSQITIDLSPIMKRQRPNTPSVIN